MGMRGAVSWIAPATVAVALLAMSSPSLAKGGPDLHSPTAVGETQEPVESPVVSQAQQEGKAGPTTPASPPPPSAKERSRAGMVPPPPGTASSSAGVIVVAAVMGALVLVLVQLVVIARLRRRLAEMASPRISDGGVPPLARLEQT